MKKILFIFDSYKPNMSPIGICCEPIFKELTQRGYDVTCIVNQGFNEKEKEIIDGVKIYRLSPWCITRIHSKRIATGSKIMKAIEKIVYKIFLALTIMTWPRVSAKYAKKCFTKAKELHDIQNFDLVVAIYLPLESLISANLLKEYDSNLKYVAYFIDSLSGGIGPRYFSKKWMLKRGQKWGKKLLYNVDKIIAMEASKMHHQKYNKQMEYYSKITYLDIPLLFKRTEKKNLECSIFFDKRQINIVYCGLIKKPQRTPEYLIELMKKVNRKDICLTLIGPTNCEKIFYNLPPNIRYFPPISHEESINVMKNADILLNMGVKTSVAISGKIFEYMSLGKPIISTYAIKDEACIRYLLEYPNALLLDESKKIDKQVIRQFESFVEINKDKKVSFNKLEEMYYKNTPNAFVNLLEETLGDV